MGSAQVERFRPAAAVSIEVRNFNMEIVSLMRAAYTLGSWDEQSEDAIWSVYWRGEDTPNKVDVPAPPPQLRQQATSDCIWEYLIDGRVERG